MTFTAADGDALLAANFAPWVRDLGLVVTEVGPSAATLRLPWSDRLAREGGALSPRSAGLTERSERRSTNSDRRSQ